MDYGIDRLKGKWNRLRKIHRMFSELLGYTGVTWDPNTNNVNAVEEVWQHFYTVHIFMKEYVVGWRTNVDLSSLF